MAALLGCVWLAWRAAAARPHEVAVTWLLTHVELGGGTIGRERLVALSWRVAQRGDAKLTAAAGSVRFAVGAAPEASGPHALRLPIDADKVELRCDFVLAAGAVVSSRAVLPLPQDRADHWTVDVGSCGPAPQP